MAAQIDLLFAPGLARLAATPAPRPRRAPAGARRPHPHVHPAPPHFRVDRRQAAPAAAQPQRHGARGEGCPLPAPAVALPPVLPSLVSRVCVCVWGGGGGGGTGCNPKRLSGQLCAGAFHFLHVQSEALLTYVDAAPHASTSTPGLPNTCREIATPGPASLLSGGTACSGPTATWGTGWRWCVSQLCGCGWMGGGVVVVCVCVCVVGGGVGVGGGGARARARMLGTRQAAGSAAGIMHLSRRQRQLHHRDCWESRALAHPTSTGPHPIL